MSHSVYFFLVLVHILSATVWIGSMIFFAAVVVPCVRRMKDRVAASELIHVSGKRYQRLGHISLGLLLLTGLALTPMRGVPHKEFFNLDTWLNTPNGQILGLKLILFFVIVALGAYHDIKVGPRATAIMKSAPGSPEALKARKAASMFGRAILLISLVILGLAIALVRGNPFT